MTSVESDLNNLRESTSDGRLSPEQFERVVSYTQVFNNMTFIFANVLNEAQNGPPMSLYWKLLEHCGPNDSFATFNWDTLLDRALPGTAGWNPNLGYGLDFRAVLDGSRKVQWMAKLPSLLAGNYSSCMVNKLVGSLHGDRLPSLAYKSIIPDSTDLFLYSHSSLPYATHKNRWSGGYVETAHCYYPSQHPRRVLFDGSSCHLSRTCVCETTPQVLSASGGRLEGVPSSPLLITPVRQKKYDAYGPMIESLWNQAVKALEEVSRVVIVGYSFPPTDTRPLTPL